MITLFENDPAELQKISHEIDQLIKQVLKFKIQILLTEPYDQSSCFLSINTGAGGTESQDWAEYAHAYVH